MDTAKLADEVGTTQRTVAAWKAGSSIPRKTMRVRIAQVLGLPSDYFLPDEHPESAQTRDILDSVMQHFNEVVASADLLILEEA